MRRTPGVPAPTAADIALCAWPDEVAVQIVDTLFASGTPLSRVEGKHIVDDFAPTGAYETVRLLLYAILASEQPAERHALLMGYGAKTGGEGFEASYSVLRDDLAVAKGDDHRTATVLVVAYVKTLLNADQPRRYYDEAALASASAQVETLLSAQLRQLAALQ